MAHLIIPTCRRRSQCRLLQLASRSQPRCNVTKRAAHMVFPCSHLISSLHGNLRDAAKALSNAAEARATVILACLSSCLHAPLLPKPRRHMPFLRCAGALNSSRPVVVSISSHEPRSSQQTLYSSQPAMLFVRSQAHKQL